MSSNENTTPTRSIEDRLESVAEAWKPAPGDKLIGQIVDVDSRTTEYGTYPIIVVLTDSGDEIAVHGFHTVLKNELAKRQPNVGERIGVKYLGKQEKYEGYKLVWQDVVPPDWNAIGVEAEADAVVEGIATDDTEAGDEQADDGIPF